MIPIRFFLTTLFKHYPHGLSLGLLIFSVMFIGKSCQSVTPHENDTIEVIEDYSELQAMIDAYDASLLLVNFWATSCPPCIKEMPHFSKLQREYGSKHVKVLLVSLDRVEDLESRVYPFVSKYGIEPEVVLLGDQNYSAWTDEIDPSWYGALPATVLIKEDKRKFRFGSYPTYEELVDDVNEMIAQ